MKNNVCEEYKEALIRYSMDFNGQCVVEPILEPLNEKYTVYPIEYRSVWNNYKDQLKIIITFMGYWIFNKLFFFIYLIYFLR